MGYTQSRMISMWISGLLTATVLKIWGKTSILESILWWKCQAQCLKKNEISNIFLIDCFQLYVNDCQKVLDHSGK